MSGNNGVRVGRQVREGWVRGLKGRLRHAQTVVVARLAGIPAGDLNRLRQSLAACGGSLDVVKNSLCRLAFRDIGWIGLESLLQGTCGVGVIRGDSASACKLLVQFSKDHEGFLVQGGMFEGERVLAQDFVTLAALPPRAVLIGRVAGGIQAPLAGLVGALQGLSRKLVGVVLAILENRGAR